MSDPPTVLNNLGIPRQNSNQQLGPPSPAFSHSQHATPTSNLSPLVSPSPNYFGNGQPDRHLPLRSPRAEGSREITDVSVIGHGQNGRNTSRDITSDNTPSSDSRQPVARRPNDRSRICGKCNGPLTGQFVRALGGTYHLECFTCHVRCFFISI